MSFLLALLFPIAVQYQRGGWKKVLLPVALLALLIDVFVNYTEAALVLWSWPPKGHWTVSKRLKVLVADTGWRGGLSRPLAAVLNHIDPGHI